MNSQTSISYPRQWSGQIYPTWSALRKPYLCDRRTKDLRYESKDSRERLNGSFSRKAFRWCVLDAREDDENELRLCLEYQDPGFWDIDGFEVGQFASLFESW
jgi:hypothetical protein